MGHIAHLRKQFKSISTYDYIITLIKRGKISHNLLFENWMVLHLNKLESHSPKDALCQVRLKLAQWFWRRRLKCEKFMTTTTMMTDKFSSEKLTCASGSGELKKSIDIFFNCTYIKSLIRKTNLCFWLRWAKKVNWDFIQYCTCIKSLA